MIGFCSIKTREVSVFLVSTLLLLTHSNGARSAEKGGKTETYAGIAIAVEPTQMTIAGKDGNNLTILTREDFTEKVAVGSQVTATYRIQEGNNILQFLLYQPENFFQPINEVRARVQKIIILAKSDVEGADEFFDAMASYLESNVGWFVAPRMLAEEIRNRVLRASRTIDLVDPKTGGVDISQYVRPQQNLIKRLATQTRVDAVLEATLEQVTAPLSRGVATWDGVQESAATGSIRTWNYLSLAPVKGQVAATTVTLRLRNPDGKLMWGERRGFCVLALNSGIGNKFRDRPISEVLRNQSNVNRWFAMVFNSFLPSRPSAQAGARQ
jgi:hypothetical protein